jgi:hypothetical protein
MTSITKTTYASDADVVVSKKTLNSGEFIQLKIDYEQPGMERMGAYDTIVVTLKPEAAKDLVEALQKL